MIYKCVLDLDSRSEAYLAHENRKPKPASRRRYDRSKRLQAQKSRPRSKTYQRLELIRVSRSVYNESFKLIFTSNTLYLTVWQNLDDHGIRPCDHFTPYANEEQPDGIDDKY